MMQEKNIPMASRYQHIETQIVSIRQEAEANKLSMEQIESEATDKITELESIKEDATEVADELADYISSLDGLTSSIERAEGVVDEAQTQGIEI